MKANSQLWALNENPSQELVILKFNRIINRNFIFRVSRNLTALHFELVNKLISIFILNSQPINECYFEMVRKLLSVLPLLNQSTNSMSLSSKFISKIKMFRTLFVKSKSKSRL